ncbi:acyltransferase [Aerococcaceae bacterium DSM 111021]|nr:acyltransferase [Aerococcaceae bacterium DSM 111021]
MSKNYNIDKVKFIAAIGVVLIHVFAFIDSAYNEPLIELQWPRAIFNYAVPLFFAITGYILSSRTNDYMLKYAGSILRLFITISLFYYVVSLFMAGFEAWLYQEPVMDAVMVIFRSKTWRQIVQGTIGSYHLWYLWASWIGILLLYVLRKINLAPKALIGVVFVSYLLSLYCMEHGILTDVLRYGGFPKALMYTTIGYYVGVQGDYWKYNLRVLIGWMVVYVVTFGFFYQGKYIELLFIPTVYLVITFLNRYKGKKTMMAKLGDYSDQIYLLHALGINVYGLLMFILPEVLIHSLPLRVIVITLFAAVFSLLLYIPLNRFYMQPMQKGLKKLSFKKDKDKDEQIQIPKNTSYI